MNGSLLLPCRNSLLLPQPQALCSRGSVTGPPTRTAAALLANLLRKAPGGDLCGDRELAADTWVAVQAVDPWVATQAADPRVAVQWQAGQAV